MSIQVKAVFLGALALTATACQTGSQVEFGPSPGLTTPGQAEVQPGSAGPACQQLITIARNAMREALKNEKDKLPVVGLDDDRFWAIQTEFQAPGKWRVGWGGNPAGGGFNGHVIIDKASGQIDSVHVGRHLR